MIKRIEAGLFWIATIISVIIFGMSVYNLYSSIITNSNVANIIHFLNNIETSLWIMAFTLTNIAIMMEIDIINKDDKK